MSAPFFNEKFIFSQPDSTQLTVRGFGNQYTAVFETEDGYTTVENPKTGYFEYAKLSNESDKLIPSGICVDALDPQVLGLPKHLRSEPAAVKEEARRMKGMLKTKWRDRIKEAKRQSRITKGAFKLGANPSVLPSPPQLRTVGKYVGLCLLIEFPDVMHTIQRDEVSLFCNKPGYRGYGNHGSVMDYFHDNSGGKMVFTNLVAPWYTARHSRSYYTDERIPDGQRAQELIKEALMNLKINSPNDMNFNDLSRDSSGDVYALSVFYAGTRINNWSKGLWPHAWALLTSFQLSNGVSIHDYQITDMTDELSLGTFCHENGHMVCDFPDLYDYGNQSSGVGIFCLMCAGSFAAKNPSQICGYLKMKAGWGTVQEIIDSGTYTIKNNEFFVFYKNKSHTEYFIMEGRFNKGRDEVLPISGLAVWHVDELGNQDFEQMTHEQHYECSLKQADGKNHLEKQRSNHGDEGDLFQPGQTFSNNTNPRSTWWSGKDSGLTIKDIVIQESAIQFTVNLSSQLTTKS